MNSAIQSGSKDVLGLLSNSKLIMSEDWPWLEER